MSNIFTNLVARVSRVLKHEIAADVKHFAENPEYVFQCAAKAGDVGALQFLEDNIGHGRYAHLELEIDNDDNYALFQAATNNHVECVQFILDRVDPEPVEIQMACRNSFEAYAFDTAQLLLDYKDVCKTTDFKMLLLDTFKEMNHLERFEEVLSSFEKDELPSGKKLINLFDKCLEKDTSFLEALMKKIGRNTLEISPERVVFLWRSAASIDRACPAEKKRTTSLLQSLKTCPDELEAEMNSPELYADFLIQKTGAKLTDIELQTLLTDLQKENSHMRNICRLQPDTAIAKIAIEGFVKQEERVSRTRI